MAKKLIWIDDRMDDMMKVAQGMFHLLWTQGIFNKTFFFGDAFQEVLAESVGGYQYLVATEFLKLRRREDILGTAAANHLNEIYNHFFTNSRSETLSALATRVPLENTTVHAVVEAWKASDNATTWESRQPLPDHFDVAPIFDFIDFDNDTAFALDVILLDGDDQKLNCEKDLAVPIISMELYRYITTTLHAKCTLYSRYTYWNRLQQNWCSLYTARYGESPNPPVIHCRRGLYIGHIQPEVRDELIGLFSTEEVEQGDDADQNSQ